jgi:hypothetical protein
MIVDIGIKRPGAEMRPIHVMIDFNRRLARILNVGRLDIIDELEIMRVHIFIENRD